MNPRGWRVIRFDPMTQEQFEGTEYPDEASAREAFEGCCKKAEQEGGGYELRNGSKWVCLFSVNLPTKGKK